MEVLYLKWIYIAHLFCKEKEFKAKEEDSVKRIKDFPYRRCAFFQIRIKNVWIIDALKIITLFTPALFDREYKINNG